MLAAAKVSPGIGVEVVEVAPPGAGPGVLVDMIYAGICGSDLATYEWKRSRHHLADRMPLLLGHEGVGRVVESSDVRFEPGTRVAIEPILACGSCRNCRIGRENLCPEARRLGSDLPGTIAEQLRVPASACIAVPDTVGDEEAAILEIMGVAMHGIRRVGIAAGARTAVIGPGAVGCCLVQLLAAFGAEVTLVGGSKRHEARLVTGQAMGADCTVIIDRPAEVSSELRRSFDAVFEASGDADAVGTAAALVAPGGSAVLLGAYGADVTFDYQHLVKREEIDLISSRARVSEDWRLLMRMIRSGRFSPIALPSEIVDIAQVEDGFRMLADRVGRKVLIDCGGTG